MFPDYRYPAEGFWEAGSTHGADGLAKLILRLMNRRGVIVKSDFAGLPVKRYDVKLDIEKSVSISFRDNGVGCTMRIYIFDQEKERDIFLEIWQNLIDNDYVFDAIFKKKAGARTEAKEETRQDTTVGAERKTIPEDEQRARAKQASISNEEKLSESEWRVKWLKTLLVEAMSPGDRLKRFFLFFVYLEHSKITDDNIEISYHRTWSEVDDRAHTDFAFQNMARDFCSVKKKPHPKCVVSEIYALGTLIKFFDRHKKEFNYPNLPKAP